jgi:hypothetical protein
MKIYFHQQAKIKVCWLALVLIFLISGNVMAQGGDERIILLRHSTGGNLFEQGGVAKWFANYNSENGTSYDISMRAYPNSPYPWNNYPYDYWNLWVNPKGPANSNNPNIDTLDHLAQNYDVIIWKHCFPGAAVRPDTGSPNVSSSVKRLENYKLQYRAIRAKLDSFPDTIFIVWTLVPLHRLSTTPEESSRARQFVDWVRNEWLVEDQKPHPNIFIFDFWSYAAEGPLTTSHPNGVTNTLKYNYEGSHSGSDSHPNKLANQTIGPIFAKRVVDVVNEFNAHKPDSPLPQAPKNLRIIRVE